MAARCFRRTQTGTSRCSTAFFLLRLLDLFGFSHWAGPEEPQLGYKFWVVLLPRPRRDLGLLDVSISGFLRENVTGFHSLIISRFFSLFDRSSVHNYQHGYPAAKPFSHPHTGNENNIRYVLISLSYWHVFYFIYLLVTQVFLNESNLCDAVVDWATFTPAGAGQPVMVAVGVVLGLIMCGSCLMAGVWWKRRYSASVLFLKTVHFYFVIKFAKEQKQFETNHNYNQCSLPDLSPLLYINKSFFLCTFSFYSHQNTVILCKTLCFFLYRKKVSQMKNSLPTGHWSAHSDSLNEMFKFFIITSSCVSSLTGCPSFKAKSFPCPQSELISYPLERNVHDALPAPPLNGETGCMFVSFPFYYSF